MDEILKTATQYGLPWAILAWIAYKTFNGNGILHQLRQATIEHTAQMEQHKLFHEILRDLADSVKELSVKP